MQIVPRLLPGERKAATSSENPVTGGAPSDSSPRGVMPRSDANATNTSQPATSNIPQSFFKGGITLNIVALFFVMLFFWYSQITVAPFKVGVDLIYTTLTNLNQWFLLEAKGPTIAAATGEGVYALPQQMRVVISWLSVAFVAIGVLSTVVRYKRMVAIPNSGRIKPNFLQSKFEMEYFVMAMACSAILVLSVVVPYILKVYSMERAYFQMLPILSLFFVTGGIMVAKWLRARPHWIILVVLIPFFMCITGTMYQILGHPASIVLNSEGWEYELWYVHDQDSYAAKWIKEYRKEGVGIYTGAWPGPRVLSGQAKIPRSQIWSFISHYQEGHKTDGYLYLRHIDIIVDRIVTEYPDIFAGKSKIYSNGSSAVYR